MKAHFIKYHLNFKKPSATSRGILTSKETFFIIIQKNNKKGIGECALFRGLSIDDRPDYEEKLQWLCDNIHNSRAQLLAELTEFPSLQFGLEQALQSLQGLDSFMLFSGPFSSGTATIPINGLIWMGPVKAMQQQIREKIEAGFGTLKLKIGALDFKAELELIKSIRKEFTKAELELRVDANGAFSANSALEKLKQLSQFDLHSIEQPIKQGQWEQMAALCSKTPLPIALDEELIGVFSTKEREALLKAINPQYIILKPSLIGGFKASSEWIQLAKEKGIGWWITSALESNIGLNAIAQYTASLKPKIPQGLGTGGLFTNNFNSPLLIKKGELAYEPNRSWQFNL